MASNTFSADNVFELMNANDSDFLGSESSGEEREEVYTYRGLNFRGGYWFLG